MLTVGVRRKLGLASPFDMRYSNPIDLHAIALLHPKLNFVVPHFGHITVGSDWKGFVAMVAPQDLQVLRRW